LQSASERKVKAIEATASTVTAHYLVLAQPLRQKLEDIIRRANTIGWPTSFVQVAGQRDLEKPFNRLLRWWSSVNADHGAGAHFLVALARKVELVEMVEDLEGGEIPRVYNEESVELETAKEPDLLVTTRRAALMVENKVWSPESGDQYKPYLALFHRLAGPGRKTRAILTARDRRDRPEGWDGFLFHKELARIFRDVSEAKDIPIWGRISAVLCAVSFEDEYERAELLKRGRTLVRDLSIGKVRPLDLQEMREIISAVPMPPSPWKVEP
jgi:hypothetical protein